MKGILCFLLLLTANLLAAQSKFELLWQDSFDGPALDTNHWGSAYTWGRTIVTNHEQQYYTNNQNIKLQNGLLHITAKRQPICARVSDGANDDVKLEDSLTNLRQFAYTSGMIRAMNTIHYGKIEVRCKLPKGNGTWPACWLFAANCGEIDVFEKPWKFHHSITTNLHYDSAGIPCSNFQFTKPAKRNTFSKQFHTYTLEWTPGKIKWLIDNKPVRTEQHSYDNCNMELIINLAVANDNFWGHAPKHKHWHSTLQIDDVKIYKLLN